MKKIFLIMAILAIFAVACQQNANQKIVPDVSSLIPEQVVTLYFQAWNDKQFDVMYSLISDGFKQIEPTAKSFGDFKSYMSKFIKMTRKPG